ncbi:MAG: flavodoxin family protein [Gammaproteobacteria bacterium]
MAKVLLVYYSRTGYTASIAHELADASGWDVEQIEDRHSRTGHLGFLRSLADVSFGRHAPIKPAQKNPADYALLVLGAPVWMGRLSSPVRSYIAAQREHFPRLAFFCTYGGRGAERAAREVTTLAGRPLVATLAITDAEIDQARYWGRLGAFQKQLAALPATG